MRYPTEQEKQGLYDRYTGSYERRTRGFSSFLQPDYRLFLNALPGRRILDLGSGPGRDSLVFQRRGFLPVCLDLSSSMLGRCQAKGLETWQMNMEDLQLPSQSFDGIWSYTSLTTLPKFRVWEIIDKLQLALSDEGALFLGLIEGEGEAWKEPDQKYSLPRFVSRYQVEEVLQACVARGFTLFYFRRLDKKMAVRNTYLNFLIKKI